MATDLAWKYALGLDLDDPGFDASVLSEFRSRVIAHELEEKPLDLLLAARSERGLLAAGGKHCTDSTRVISAVRDVNRVELAGECVRAAGGAGGGRARLGAAGAGGALLDRRCRSPSFVGLCHGLRGVEVPGVRRGDGS